MQAKTRKEAREKGLQFYTGRPCKRGHPYKRYAKTGDCVECARLRRAKVREVARIYNKKYQLENRQKLNEISNRWYWRNRDLISERMKTKYIDKVRQWSRNRKARKKGADGKHTASDVLLIRRLQRGRCACCREKLQKFHVDHIFPLSGGGSNNKENIQLLCAECNLRKSDHDPLEFMRQEGMLL